MVLKLILKPLILQEPSLETEAYNQRANFQFLRHHLCVAIKSKCKENHELHVYSPSLLY